AEALLSGAGASGVTGGTFHSFANEALRRFAAPFGGPSRFTILDRGDAEDAVGLVRARLGLDEKNRRFPRKQTLATLFSSAVNRNLDLRRLVETEAPQLVDELPDILRCRDAY